MHFIISQEARREQVAGWLRTAWRGSLYPEHAQKSVP